MEDEDDSDRFRDEDGDISIKTIRGSDGGSDLERHQGGDDCPEAQNPQEQPRRLSGRNLDDFLEAGFQATKGQTHTTLPSAPAASSLVNSSSYNSINSAIEASEDGNTGDTSDRLNATETNHNNSRIPLSAFRKQWKYWSLMLALGVANSSDATEILCISYILADPVFRETVLGSHGAGLLAAAVFLGMLLGGLVVGSMGDWIGRKPMLLLGLVLNAVSGVLFSLAPNFYLLSFLRCVAGFGIGATIPPLFTLTTELAPPSARGFCITVIASFWMVGSIYVALTAMWCFEGSPSSDGDRDDSVARAGVSAYLTTTWRIFALICSVPSALGATLVYLLIPESPRFLGLEGRSGEAVEIANSLVDKMNGGNASSTVLPLTIEELERTFPASALRDLEDRQRQNTNPGFGFESDRLNDVLGFLRTVGSDFVASTSKLYEPNLKQTTLALQLVWFSLSFGSYGLMTWINIIFEKVQLENIYFNALLFAAANLPGNILAAIFLDKIQRSTSLIGSIICAAVSLLLFAVSALKMHPFGIVASACLFQCFTVVSWNTIDTMTSELFPTLVRSTGWGICAASARIGALIAQFVNGVLIDNPVRLLLVASGTLVVGALTPCLLPGGVGGDMTGRPVHDDLQSAMIPRGSLSTQGIGGSGGEPIDKSTANQRGGGGIVRRTSRRPCSSESEGG
jgi:VNT family MFS transporter (synaptic vesicle glycoprotein 2)